MGYARGTAKTVLLEPGIKAGDIEAINISPVDESAAFVYLDGHRYYNSWWEGPQWSFTGDSAHISPV